MKKVQVFVSSTYEDLKSERQDVVQAILDNGDIPAGMELFSASDESQMITIKKWIEESDIYMLIIGSRYGSIEEKSGKSYTQLEYEYVLEIGKPMFSLISTYVTCESNDLDRELFKSFREKVYTKIIREFSNSGELKYNTVLSINSLKDKYSDQITGWTKGTADIEIKTLKDELIEQQKKYEVLNMQFQSISKKYNDKKTTKTLIGSLTYDETYSMLKKKIITIPKGYFGAKSEMKVSLINILDSVLDSIASGVKNQYGTSNSETFIYYNVASYLVSIGLADSKKSPGGASWSRITLNKNGQKFASLYRKELSKNSKSE